MQNRRAFLTSLFATAALAPLASGLLSSEAQAQMTAPGRPPASPSREKRPPAPGQRYTWIPGYWAWVPHRGWVWHDGFWDRSRIGFRFVGPRWVLRRGQWTFEPGRWVPTRRW